MHTCALFLSIGFIPFIPLALNVFNIPFPVMTSSPHEEQSAPPSDDLPQEQTTPPALDIFKPNPIALPEILLTIGRFLDKHTLIQSRCVSHAWYTILHPLIWNHLLLYPAYHSRNPSLAAVQSHASWVQYLEIGDGIVDLQLRSDLVCPNLSHVTMAKGLQPFHGCSDFIRRHGSRLKSVSTYHSDRPEILEALMSSCSSLRNFNSMP